VKIGDLVRFFSDESDYAGEIGIIIREVPGSKVLKERENRMLVLWPRGSMCSYSVRQLEVINASR
jgi:hypothetical protein